MTRRLQTGHPLLKVLSSAWVKECTQIISTHENQVSMTLALCKPLASGQRLDWEDNKVNQQTDKTLLDLKTNE